MDELIGVISGHLGVEDILIVATFWIFNAAIQSMPEPLPTSSRGYVWFFNFAHTIGGNIKLVSKVATRRQIQQEILREDDPPPPPPPTPKPPLYVK